MSSSKSNGGSNDAQLTGTSGPAIGAENDTTSLNNEEVEEIGVCKLVSFVNDPLEVVYISDASRSDPLFLMQMNRNKLVNVRFCR
jgi:hypothetical protein